MNPAMNAGVSGGLSGAIVTIINSWFVAFQLTPMTADVATAYAVVLTAGLGYFFHTRSLASSALPVLQLPDPKPAAAAAAMLLAAIVGSYLLFGIAPAQAAAHSSAGSTAAVFIVLIGVSVLLPAGFLLWRRGRAAFSLMAGFIVIAFLIALTGCGGTLPPVPTPAQIEAEYQKAKPILDQLCAAGSVAGGAAIAIEQMSGNGGDIADTQKAVASLGDVCGDKNPGNVQQDVATAKQLYQDITAKAAAATPAAPNSP